MNNSSAHHELNSSDEKIPSFDFMPGFVYPVTLCHIFIVVVAAVGNFLVCCAILANRNLRINPTNLFIFSLALSDLLTVTLVVPFDIEGIYLRWVWNHGEMMCRAWITMYLITVPTSILTLLAVSVDRYKSLSDPLNRFRRCRFMTRKRAFLISFIIWLYSFLFALIPVMGWRTEDNFVQYNVCYFPFPMLYFILTSVLNFILPVLITCGIYFKIYMIASTHHHNVDGDKSRKFCTTEEKKMYSRNVKAAKTISIFVGAFFCCWVPYSSVSIFAFICGESCAGSIPYEARIVLLMFGYLNSALNPFLFAFRNRRFKAAYSLMIRSLRVRSKHESTIRRSTMTQSTIGSDVIDSHDSDVRLLSMRPKGECTKGQIQPKL